MAQHHAIAVVGAGPRGTSLVERVCASVPDVLGADDHVVLHVIDPSPPGAGRVWRREQSEELLMNTVASQVTLFTDDSVEAEGPIRPGPSLHTWLERTAPGELGPDDYPSRSLYGAYLEWVFGEVLRTAPGNVTVTVHGASAVRLRDTVDADHAGGHGSGGHRTGRHGAGDHSTCRHGSDDHVTAVAGRFPLQTVELSDGTRIPGLTAVVLAQGHLPTTLGSTEARLTAHAQEHGLHYLPPANPADVTAELEALPPGGPVLLRGLGLNFFDHMALLTSGRGGRFVEQPDADGPASSGPRLRYIPSGREPRLLAGSRRGVPYHARGDNEKGAYGRHLPLVLTPDVIEGFRLRTDAGTPPDFLAEIWPLVAKEVETVYYTALLEKDGHEPDRSGASFRRAFLSTAYGSAEETAVLDAFGVGVRERWDWEAVCRPHGKQRFGDRGAFRAWLLGTLRDDVAQARLGNVSSPVKAALDALRDLRNELRRIVDHRGLHGTSRRDHLDRWYTPLNAFLSIGPPRRRIEEMAALVEAGVLDVVGPGMEVRPVPGGFEAHSPAVPGSRVTAGALVEARLPEPDLRRTADPLLCGLLRTGDCRPHTVDGYETGGLDVTQRPYRLVDARGRVHPRRYAVGVPTEGVHWVTAAGARPGVNSVTLTDTDAVARAVLESCAARRGSAAVPASVPEQAGANDANDTNSGANKVAATEKIELASVVR